MSLLLFLLHNKTERIFIQLCYLSYKLHAFVGSASFVFDIESIKSFEFEWDDSR